MPKATKKQDASSAGVRTRYPRYRRCGCQLTRTEGRSLAQIARSGFARFGTLILCDCRSRRFEGVGKQVVSLRNAY